MQALGALDAFDAIELVGNRNPQRLRKVYRQRYDPFTLRDDEFKRRYRFTKNTAAYIIDLVKDDLLLDGRGCGTTPALQVLTAIRCWGRREVQDDGGKVHGLSQSTVSRICDRVARALAQHSATFIQMPQTLAEQQRVMREFSDIQGFPTVLGCIDCTHIKTRIYDGRSLNVQAVCDAKLKIRDIVARWRDSTHDDARIFNESALKERFERGQFKGRLLGDSGYGLEPYLFTPILRPQNAKEEAYNRSQIATRNCIERCFGVWKQRFQMLNGITVRMPNVKSTIVALAVLHNIAIDQEEPLSEYDELENPNKNMLLEAEMAPPPVTEARRTVKNEALLRAFIDRHFE